MCGYRGPGDEKAIFWDWFGAEAVVVEANSVLISQAYCRRGHELILPDNAKFDGKPGIGVTASVGDRYQLIFLSPYQGDPRKKFDFDYPEGTLVSLTCPWCKEPFPEVAPHDCHKGAMYLSLFLKPDADVQTSICICNAWGCYASFAKLFDEVITDLRQFVPGPGLG